MSFPAACVQEDGRACRTVQNLWSLTILISFVLLVEVSMSLLLVLVWVLLLVLVVVWALES